MPLTRRELFRWCGVAALARYVPACGSSATGVFTGDDLAALKAFANVVIPEDDEPGGVGLGAIEYIETLIRAFDQPVPAIFAGGPFSDRNPLPDAPAPNDFATFIELDRVADAAWRMTVLGSSALPDGAPNEALLGPVLGLEERLRAGLRAAIATAGRPIDELSQDERTRLFDKQDDDWKQLVIELVTEAAFAAPEYGGNRDLAGWKLCHFEGDNLPRGFSQYTAAGYVESVDSPVSMPNPGPDPAPISEDVDQLVSLVIRFLGGRVRA